MTRRESVPAGRADEQGDPTVLCRIATTTLPRRPQASALARRFLLQKLTAWQVDPDDIDRAVLLSSEAVANAVVHAGTSSGLTVVLVGPCLEVGVSDLSPRRPPAVRSAQARGREPAETKDLLAESGRGMLLIEALADAWGVQDLSEGKQVWFRFQIDRHQDAPCACDDDEADAVLLASGARVVDMLAS